MTAAVVDLDKEGASASTVDMSIVAGNMDGERPPLTLLEDVKQNLDDKLEPLQKKYGHYLTKLRPWREFVRCSRPQGDKLQRLNANLSHYQINYALVFLALMAASIVMNPKCLVAIVVLALAWVGFLWKNDDPNWEVKVADVSFGKTQRWLILCVITSVVLLNVVGHILFSVALSCGLLVISHAVMHPPPQTDEADCSSERFIEDVV